MKNKKHNKPDFTPEHIPTLEDIIERGVGDDEEKTSQEAIADSVDTADDVTPFDIHLFLAKSREQAAGGYFDETEPQLGDLNLILDAEPDDTEAVRYDYEEDYLDDNGLLPTDYYADEEDITSIIDMQSIEPAPQTSIKPISVGNLVKNIVKEMMPDLEQQLVFMLQKAIEEKLPKELIKTSDSESSDSDSYSDHNTDNKD